MKGTVRMVAEWYRMNRDYSMWHDVVVVQTDFDTLKVLHSHPNLPDDHEFHLDAGAWRVVRNNKGDYYYLPGDCGELI